MGGKTGRVLFHRRLGNVDRLGRRFLPLDRFRLTGKRPRQHLVHAVDWYDIEPALDAVVDLDKILGVFFGDQHGFDAAAQSRQELLLETADRQHAAAQRDLAGHRYVAMDRDTGHHRDNRRDHGDARGWAILWGCTLGHVHVDVALVKHGRLNAEGDRPHANVRRRRGDRLLHHVAEVARDGHLALAGHHGRLDGEQFAAHIGPGKTGHHADLILVLDFAVTELWYAEIVGQVAASHLHRLGLLDREFLHRLADQGR